MVLLSTGAKEFICLDNHSFYQYTVYIAQTPVSACYLFMKVHVKVGKDQEIAQLERNSHCKNRGG